MTLHEIFHRVIRAHWLVIGLCTVVPVLLVVVLQRGQSPEWTGSVRIQVVSAAPVSTTEADAVSSRVLALATTPTLVSKALDEAGLTDDPTAVAQHDVTATRLGESPVVDVSVTASSPERARDLSAALVHQVVTFMNNGSRPALDERLTALDDEIAQVDASRKAMTDRIALTRDDVARQALIVRITAAEDQLTQLTAQRSVLLQTKLSVDQAVVIDGDNPEVHLVASTLVPRAALALVLGLVVGLAIAILIETFTPRLAGIRALARLLMAPVLGRSDESPAELASTMALAARRQGVEMVVVMGVDESDAAAATSLLDRLPRPSAEETAKAPVKSPAKGSSGTGRPRNGQRQQLSDPFTRTKVTFSSLAGLAPEAEHTAGVVVVSAGSCRVRDVDDLRDRLTALRWPVVGLVEVTSPNPSRPSLATSSVSTPDASTRDTVDTADPSIPEVADS
jgi:capsular polysaccharide biosynthesis protein